MGQVFLGRSPAGRPIAVKVVRPEYGADQEFRRRFAHTSTILSSGPYPIAGQGRAWLKQVRLALPQARANERRC